MGKLAWEFRSLPWLGTHSIRQSPGVLGLRTHLIWFRQIYFNKVITYRRVSRINRDGAPRNQQQFERRYHSELPMLRETWGPGLASCRTCDHGGMHTRDAAPGLRGTLQGTNDPTPLSFCPLISCKRLSLTKPNWKPTGYVRSPMMQAEHSQPLGQRAVQRKNLEQDKTE